MKCIIIVFSSLTTNKNHNSQINDGKEEEDCGFLFPIEAKEALVFFNVELLATSFTETFVKRLLLFFVPCTFKRCC